MKDKISNRSKLINQLEISLFVITERKLVST
jgi:hypothetical protein